MRKGETITLKPETKLLKGETKLLKTETGDVIMRVFM